MNKRKDYISLILCYVLWGFQPFYWAFLDGVDSFVILAFRIIMAAVFSVLLLALTGRLEELKAAFCDRSVMKYLVPAVVFLLADWGVFILAVVNGHVLDCSLGYYISPLIIFAISVLVYKEKSTPVHYIALGIAVVGIIISTVSFGSFPLLALIISFNWSIYAAVKKNVKLDGVVSIAAETLMLTPLAIAFLLIFKRADLAAISSREALFLVGSGIVTALPMFLYSNCIAHFSLIIMCFAQYLSPSFNLFCGLTMGESFSRSQLVSFLFFLTAIIVFTVGELRAAKHNGDTE